MSLSLGGMRARLWIATALPALLVIVMLVIGFASTGAQGAPNFALGSAL